MTTTAPSPLTRPIRDGAGFLRNVPRLAGCTPRNSLVVVPLDGAAAAGALRIDLPCVGSWPEAAPPDGAAPDDGKSGGPGSPALRGDGSDKRPMTCRALDRRRSLDAAIDQVAATAVGMACRIAEVDAIAVVAYAGEERWPPDGPLPQEELVDRVIDRADACGLEVRGAFLVTQDGWGAYGDVTGPASLTEIVPEAAAALAGDQHGGTDLPAVTNEERAAIAVALTRREREFAAWLVYRHAAADRMPGSEETVDDVGRAPDRRDSVHGTDDTGAPPPHAADEPVRSPRSAEPTSPHESPRPDEPLPPLDALPEIFERALCWDPLRLDAADAAVLALTFETPMLRDAMLTQWSSDVTGGRECLSWQLAWRPDGAVDREHAPPGPFRLAGDGPPPEPWRMRQGLALARRVAAAAPPRAQGGALASAAWLSWALGSTTHAAHYIEAALEREPQHSFARLIEVLVVANRLPAWAFRRGEAAEAVRVT